MNPSDILFNAVSGLTGGIVHDLQTAMVAVVTILFVLLGLDLLKDVLFGGRSGELNLETRAFDDEWDAAKYYHKLSKRYKRGSIEFDIRASCKIPLFCNGEVFGQFFCSVRRTTFAG